MGEVRLLLLQEVVYCGENSKSNFVWPPPIFGDHQANVQI